MCDCYFSQNLESETREDKVLTFTRIQFKWNYKWDIFKELTV